MLVLRLILLVVHIAAAAVSFGAPLGLGRLLRGVASLDAKAYELVAKDTAKRTGLGRICGLVSMFSGLALIFLRGGFGAVGKNYHTALLLMWALLGVQFFIARPVVRKLVAAIGGAVPSPQELSAAAGKLGMAIGIGHALWVTILILMFQQF
jgi:hypothetical protein